MSTHRLPTPATPFVGRSRELAEIAALLSDPTCRLLTLLGPGGIGKTRLAIQAAADQLPNYADGVCFVPLAAVGSALQISFYGSEDPRLQIAQYLREKQILLVMDNFEHLLEGVALLTDILQAAAGVKFLVTSRERLNVQEEWVLPVDGLDFPEESAADPLESYSAVKLFVQRAQQINARFLLSDNREAVKTICQRVEGMPLGLELAVTWLRAMTCRQIAARIGSLDFLTTPLRNAPERHRSLRGVFEQSWKLLSPAEQDVLMRLSVFRGGFDLEAAEQVAGATLPILAGLVDKSLIRLNADGRYDLHELLRQYGAEKVETASETEATADRHLDYFLRLAEQAEANQFGRAQIPWFDRLEVELDNLRAVLAWSLQSEETEKGLHLAAVLGWFFSERTHWNEGMDWLERMLAANPDAPASLRAKALHSAGALAGILGDKRRVRTLCEQALALALATNDRWNIAWSLSHLALYARNDPAQSAALSEESLALFRELDDPMGVTHTLLRRSWYALGQKDYPYVRRLLEETLIRAREVGDKVIIAWVTYNTGWVTWFQDHDLTQARLLLESSLLLFREARFQIGYNNSLWMLADLEWQMGNVTRAQMRNEEHLISLWKSAQNISDLSFTFTRLASIARVRGQFERAASLLGAANSTLASKRDPAESATVESDGAALRAQLGETAFAQAWAAGNAMMPEQAIAYALEGRATPIKITSTEGCNEPEAAPPQTPASDTPTDLLSRRELDVLRLIPEGLSNAEIASRLFLSVSTVKWYLSEIYGKLGVNSRTQAVAEAQKLHLL